MAEAAVVEPLPTRFYCHVCNVEINIPNTDFTCPLCSGGFVEELPANAPAGSPLGGNRAAPLADRDHTAGPLRDLREEIETLLMSRNVGSPLEFLGGGSNSNGSHFIFGLDGSPSGSRRSGTGSGMAVGGGGTATATLPGGSGQAGGGGRAGGRVRPANLAGLDTVLLDFLHSLTTGGGPFGPVVSGVGGNMGRDGGNNTFWMGNLGDYAWGREGIDTIVTQLLNQMETSGPPPLARDKIDAIPTVEVTEEDVQRKSQCSVCWEDFQLKEPVRKLPCSHIYHENCIVPWLDLHGTCPICRKSLSSEEDESCGSQDVNMEMNDLNRLCPMHRRTDAGNGTATTSTATNTDRPMDDVANQSQGSHQRPQPQQQQQQTRNNVFTFDDSNMDLD